MQTAVLWRRKTTPIVESNSASVDDGAGVNIFKARNANSFAIIRQGNLNNFVDDATFKVLAFLRTLLIS